MDKAFFQGEMVLSDRIIYTPSDFARASLSYLQETGSLSALRPHISKRANLDSYLFFIVISGLGKLVYAGTTYQLKANDCVFIDCKKPYSHQTDNDLWRLKWVHFNGANLPNIYDKYISRGGEPVFTAENPEDCIRLLDDIYQIAGSDDYIRDMKLNEKLCSLLTIIMSKSWHPENSKQALKRQEVSSIKAWLDEHYKEKIVLDELSKQFFIDKYYLTKIFKEQYGTTINVYISNKRITQAKQLLRFSDKSVEQIAEEVGITDSNYFTRQFKKIEGITPVEYRKLW